MNTKFLWGGAVLTVLLVFGVALYRQMKKALGVISSALSSISVDTYVAW
jgi:hypothetical protein